ncbi:C-type mannose receptor 2-like [Nasonia vitripennis]|uniref:C-type lectin domain-containing protein n=1 Tax=Nasonia vitripennis TaxID=7425 RepID=A0A7M7QLH5_NASVI|nr:C-type mannose receptor 2-like [Nasonia vitripennis]
MKPSAFKLLFCIFLASVYGHESYNQPIVEFYVVDDIQYVFFSQRVTWDEANMLCTTSNARLAVLDNLDKAAAVAKAMSESNIVMEDAWLGGRRSSSGWVWIENNNITSKKHSIPLKSSVDDFPPWSQEPTRPSKECLAIDRRLHSHPNFVDLDCRLLRPYICEKKADDAMNSPVPSKWAQVQKNTYTLYHGRVTWTEAVTFCRSKGTRLAVIKDKNVINVLTNSMTKSRPDFESVWIGARFSYGQWTWLSTGSTLNPLSDSTGYPPWRFGKSEKNYGCLLLDRHLDNRTNFIELACDRKRDFVCEEYPPEELEEWMNEPTQFSYGNSTFIIYPFDKTWDESRQYCYDRGSILAHIHDAQLANLMVAAMGDHPKAISHIWLGGLYHSNRSEWKWIHNNEIIPLNAEIDFPSWAHSIVEEDYDSEESLCLNLDRSDHTKPHFYGLECENKQPFACIINCEEPPAVRNGTWTCIDQNDVKACSLECKPSFLTMGYEKVYCGIHSGWYNTPNWLEFPLCLGTHNYLERMIRSLSQDLQKSSGYYLLLSHENDKVRRFSLEFAKRLLNIFPLSNHLKMGMTNLNVDPKYSILHNQNDSCEVMQFLDNLVDKNSRKESNMPERFENWSRTILKNSRDRIVIIAIIDHIASLYSQKTFDLLKSKGHYVVTIGLKNDWHSLLPTTTIGFDQRRNLYLFKEDELETINAGLTNIYSRSTNCVRTKNKLQHSMEVTTSKPITGKELISTETESITTSTTEISTSETLANSDTTDSNNNSEITEIETADEEEKNPETSTESEKKPPASDDIYRRIYMDRSKHKNPESKPQESLDNVEENTSSGDLEE